MNFHAVEVGQHGPPLTHDFETLEELVAFIATHVNKRSGAWLFPFKGEKVTVSVPPFRLHIHAPNETVGVEMSFTGGVTDANERDGGIPIVWGVPMTPSIEPTPTPLAVTEEPEIRA